MWIERKWNFSKAELVGNKKQKIENQGTHLRPFFHHRHAQKKKFRFIPKKYSQLHAHTHPQKNFFRYFFSSCYKYLKNKRVLRNMEMMMTTTRDKKMEGDGGIRICTIFTRTHLQAFFGFFRIKVWIFFSSLTHTHTHRHAGKTFFFHVNGSFLMLLNFFLF